jgi:hypothetical protein
VVLGRQLAGQVAQSGRLGLAYAVFDAGVGAVAYFESGERKVRGPAGGSLGQMKAVWRSPSIS